ncbi:MAG: NAD(P)/FAD-dependent oxidoreductase [Pyrinomonadaceae bacterium]
MKSFDVAIIGAGIIGISCARRLAEEGFKVVLIEKHFAGSGTTSAGMGHLVVMDDSPAQLALTKYSLELWKEVSKILPANCEFENCGTIWIAADDDEFALATRKAQLFCEIGLTTELLDEKALYDAEPNLRRGLAGGLWVSGDCVVYQPAVISSFLEALKGLPAKLIEHTQVTKIERESVFLANGEIISAGIIVNACGYAATDLMPALPITKKMGNLAITERGKSVVSHQLVELGYLKSAHENSRTSVAFNVQPRNNGQILIGSSRQTEFSKEAIDLALVQKMISHAAEFLPVIRNLKLLRFWSGFRPATPDNLPYIGKYPQMPNWFVAAGHEGLGITASFATAELLTDALTDKNSQIDRTPFNVERAFSQ